MVGLVLVSHSQALARALAELVKQVTHAPVPVAIAAGAGPGHQDFGTDATEIMTAIEAVDSPDGVLVLMDLGSAILSAEMALELLPREVAGRVRFCSAPIVEGAVAAGVQAGLGSDLDTVCREAESALLPKTEHLGAQQSASSQVTAPAEPATQEQQIVLTLQNQHGLHARPAARFVQTAAAYQADIRVTNLATGKGPVSARSLNAIATLGAVHGQQIQVSAAGPQAAEALQALSQLVESNFGEQATVAGVAEVPAEVQKPRVPKGENVMPVVAISEGVALGPLFRYQPPLPAIPTSRTDQPDQEWDQFQAATEAVRRGIQQRRQQIAASVGPAEAGIFDAHLLILQDPELLGQVRQRVFDLHENAALAWANSLKPVVESYQELPDPYFRQRADDVQDVGNQVLFALAGRPASAPVNFTYPVILFAEDLTPTETAQLDMSKVLGIITIGGGPTSHAAILARALGIPAVSGAAPSLHQLPADTWIGVDGFEGELWIKPSKRIQADLEERRAAWLEQRRRLLESSHTQAATADGKRVEVAANVGSVQDARAADENGAEGIGLLRTEFLYLSSTTPPSEAEQLEALSQIGAVMGDRPVIVRTLDVGGDKQVPYLPLAQEANPFLGVRAIRLSLRSPGIFMTQLRAILRAGADHPFRIMFPMVANLEEVLQARSLLEQAHQALSAERLPHRWPIETGIMVEIPSAALLSPVIAPHVDFFSIGTNDLTQYTLAAERGNPALAGFTDGLHPAVLRLIKQVADAAHAHGKWTGICGELGGDPLAAPILIGLGVDELSMNPASIPRAKAVLRTISMPEAQTLAGEVLKLDSAPAVRHRAGQLAKLLK